MIKICYKHKQRSSVEPQKLSLAMDKLYIIKLYNLVWNLHTQGSQASISILQETLSLFPKISVCIEGEYINRFILP